MPGKSNASNTSYLKPLSCVLYIGKEHWLGLDNIYKLTNRKNLKTQLRIDLETLGGTKATVAYDDFHLKDQVVFIFT